MKQSTGRKVINILLRNANKIKNKILKKQKRAKYNST